MFSRKMYWDKKRANAVRPYGEIMKKSVGNAVLGIPKEKMPQKRKPSRQIVRFILLNHAYNGNSYYPNYNFNGKKCFVAFAKKH